jgi:ribulose 1,5-bisphosphate carboxylase large subunit-like protein
MGNRSYLICVDESAIDRSEHIIATYDVEVSETTKLDKVAETIAYDPTIGTWSKVAGETDSLIEDYSGKVLLPLPSEHVRKGIIRIAIPAHNIDPIMGGIPQLLAVLGAPYTLRQVARIHLVNLDLPKSFTKHLPGPRFGIKGIREIAGIPEPRPIIATMLKPRSGLSSEAYAEEAGEALHGGVDVIFDDELLVSPVSSPLLERVAAVQAMVTQVEEEVGQPKCYAVNITSSIRHAGDTALRVQELGVDFLYLNPVAMGLSALEVLATDERIELPILCCRSSYGMLTRGHHGMAYFVLLKLARLCGADAMHMGSVGGKLPHAIIGDDSELRSRVSWLRARIKGVRKTMPIVSGGMHPGSVAWNMERLGSNIIIQAGSGVLGHPGGPRAGGRAMRVAVETALLEKPMSIAARETLELAAAVEKWGYLDSEGIHTLAELWGDSETLSSNIVVSTEGGSVVFGNVNAQGNFIGRDQGTFVDQDREEGA